MSTNPQQELVFQIESEGEDSPSFSQNKQTSTHVTDSKSEEENQRQQITGPENFVQNPKEPQNHLKGQDIITVKVKSSNRIKELKQKQNSDENSSIQADSPVKLRRSKRKMNSDKQSFKNNEVCKHYQPKQSESTECLQFIKLPIQLEINDSSRNLDQKQRIKKQNPILVFQQEQQQSQPSSEEYIDAQQAKKQQTVEKSHQIKRLKGEALLVGAQAGQLLLKQLPFGYRVTCFLQIESNYFGLTTQYNLKVISKKQKQKVVLSAKKQHFKLYPSFIISTKKDYVTRRDTQHFGELSSNFYGTKYELKLNTNKRNSQGSIQGEGKLMTQINFDKNILGFSGMRRINVVKLNSQKFKQKEFQQTDLQNVLERKEFSKLRRISSVLPKNVKGKYKIDFHGKSKMASTKNFILQTNEKNGKSSQECLLMAKQSQKRFLLQIYSPLTIFQGFGIALANLDSKLLVN